MRMWHDPAFPGVLIGVGLAVAGLVALFLGWRGAAGSPLAPLQTPHLVSGGLGGVALVFVGAAVASVQAGRRDRAIARQEMAEVIDHLRVLVDDAEFRSALPHEPQGRVS